MDAFDKDAEFVDMFNKEQYHDPFLQKINASNTLLLAEMFPQDGMLQGTTIGIVFFVEMFVVSRYKGKNRGHLLCGVDIWDASGSTSSLLEFFAGYLVVLVALPAVYYIAQYKAGERHIKWLVWLVFSLRTIEFKAGENDVTNTSWAQPMKLLVQAGPTF